MIGIYFSGTGNSRYATELFCREYDKETRVFSIEDSDVLSLHKQVSQEGNHPSWEERSRTV